MTLLAPAFLVGALAVAAGIIALHFIVTRQPRASVLPTARFVPDSPATATVRDARPSDLLLMLLRVLVVVAAGAALSKPVLKPGRRAESRILLVDASSSVANPTEGGDSVKAIYQPGDRLIVFDSSARDVTAKGIDSLNSARSPGAAGNLSSAMISAFRVASDVRDRADSIELVIVSPLLNEEHDAATDSIRQLWPGRARVIRLAATRDSAIENAAAAIKLRSRPDDPLGVAISLVRRSDSHATVTVVRSSAISSDDSAHVIVVWPETERPPSAVAFERANISGGVMSGDAKVIAPFERRWRFPPDSIRSARVIARWVDGEPAAIERNTATGCVKSVAIPVTAVGDLVLRAEFVSLVNAITADCGEHRDSTPMSAAMIASLRGKGPLASANSFEARQDLASPLAPWLFGIALLAAIVELIVRRFGSNARDRMPTRAVGAAT